MRKLMATLITSAALGGALLAGGGPAAAAPSATTLPAAGRQAAGSAFAPPGYDYLTWYWTEENCENNGARLQVRGTIKNYYCEQSPYLTYYLWVKY